MLNNVLLKTIRDQRKPLMWWTIGIVSINLITLLFYPSFADAKELNDLFLDNNMMKAFIGDIPDLTSPEGFLDSQLFFLLIPLLFIAFSITQGTGAIAGEEEKGTLDVIVSLPISRQWLLLHKLISMFITLLILSLMTLASLVTGAIIVSMEISFYNLSAAILSAFGLSLLFGTLGFTIGSSTGKRGTSIGISGGIAVLSYFINALAPAVEGLEHARHLSAFYYYIGNDPILNGINITDICVLFSLSLAFCISAFISFNRRDLGT